MLPLFTAVKCVGSASIPFPMFDEFRPPEEVPSINHRLIPQVSLKRWPSVVEDIVSNRRKFPWHKRVHSIVFRGDPTNRACSDCATPEGYSKESLVNNTGHTTCGRHKALRIAYKNRGTHIYNFQGPPALRMSDHERYKYVMYLHGNCHWANRLRRLLFMGPPFSNRPAFATNSMPCDSGPGSTTYPSTTI